MSIVTFDDHYESSRAPQRRTVTQRAERGTIRDRFNIPLALNAIQYNASICYADIRQIPSVRWEKGPDGKKRRVLARKNYIEKLSQFLGRALHRDPQSIEDTIHGRASLFPHTPFVLKEDITEELYCQLKMEEKNWLGLQMEQTSKRVYPLGKVGCDVIGYLGAISQREYIRIAEERKELKAYLEAVTEGRAAVLPKGFFHLREVQSRLSELEKMAYSINDQVGKSGVEASFDEVLRGINGKKTLETHKRGSAQHELPGGQSAQPGERVILSLSAELQEEAEKLLAEYEDLQDERDKMGPTKRRHPRIRGGAIVAMLPKTGEVLALASHPRFDPNDFVPAKSFAKRMEKRSAITRWLESESHIGEIWDGIALLEEERFSSRKKAFYIEKTPLTWDLFLETILPDIGGLRGAIDRVSDVASAAHLQRCFTKLQELSKDASAVSLLQSLYASDGIVLSEGMEKWKRELDPFLKTISHPRDRLLFLDLLRLVVFEETIPSGLLERIGEQTLAEHFLSAQGVSYYRKEIKKLAKQIFHERDFKQWRESSFKDFLRKKRQEEREKRRYAKPYLDYLEREEQKMFQAFWKEKQSELLYAFLKDGGSAPYQKELYALRKEYTDPLLDHLQKLLQPMTKEEGLAYLQTLRSFADLNRPLLGTYPHLKKKNGVQLERHLAAAFYPYTGYGYGRSQAFRCASPMGSIFKLFPAYAGLKQQFEMGKDDLNPFTVIDDMKWTGAPGSNNQILGQHTDGTTIRRLYKGGRLPRAYPGIGKIDVVSAIERSSNIYFSLLAGDVLKSPNDLLEAARAFGLGRKTGIELPGEYRGNLPSDILHNKTGLYSFAIGQHSLVATPLQVATALCAIANGGELLQPQIVKLSVGKKPRRRDFLPSSNEYPYKENLSQLGITFPLFTESLPPEKKGYIHYHAPSVRENIFLPEEVQSVLLEGMHQVTNGTKGSARFARIRTPFQTPLAIEAYRNLHAEMAGKTGTAEILYKQTIDAESHAEMDKHVSFICISYEDERQMEPELVIAVYLRFGSAGKQGAPIAARIIEKWREIKARYQ